MAYNEILTNRVRAALAHLPRVEEKKMFGSLAFMVNGKLCISVGKDRIMTRIDPELHEEAIQRKGTQTVVMRGREYKGYVYVGEEAIKSEEDFDYWIGLALDYNKKAKASTRRNKK
ncbi:MAG: TfoX/Sxy family protein [Anaerolineae bacterium]|jgi:TfoX/Sxy family transcriptional regulator of competence genes